MPSRAAYRAARKIRVGSSRKLPACSARIRPASRSALPSCGSSSLPHDAADSDTAMALIEKSRRAKSRRIESAGRTTGRLPGVDEYSSSARHRQIESQVASAINLRGVERRTF